VEVALSSDTQIYELRRHRPLRGTALGRTDRVDRSAAVFEGEAAVEVLYPLGPVRA